MASVCLPVSKPEASSEFQLKSILLPTDFSGASDRAAQLARALAARFRSKLFLVHAVWQRDFEWEEALYHTGGDELCGEKRSQEFVASNQLDALPHEVIVMPGSPVEVVQAIAEEKNIDLIVLGTKGLRWPAKLLFGTDSEQIYRSARCSVLTVGPHVGPAKCNGEIRTIVCAVNTEAEPTANALHSAVMMARACDACLTVACILPERGARGPELYRLEEEKRAELLRLLEGEAATPHPPEIIVGTGHISDEIIKIAAGCAADLIVKGIRPPEPHPAKGHTYPISVNAHCPVLTVASRAQAPRTRG
jgi:nucleotide-binding universal stress UspA family protein